MKKIYLLILITSTVISCKSIPDFDYSKLTKTDTIYKLDLSNRNLKEQPNLSEFTIIDLNLSNNKISGFNESLLPKGIQKLNLSNNKIKNFSCQKRIIQNVNLSNNKLTTVQMPLYEDIKSDTLNVADNKNLKTKSWAFPKFYKTVINYSISTKN
jgi:hypothetical protein